MGNEAGRRPAPRRTRRSRAVRLLLGVLLATLLGSSLALGAQQQVGQQPPLSVDRAVDVTPTVDAIDGRAPTGAGIGMSVTVVGTVL